MTAAYQSLGAESKLAKKKQLTDPSFGKWMDGWIYCAMYSSYVYVLYTCTTVCTVAS